MATHFSILAWRISQIEEPGGLQFMGYKESDMTATNTFTFHEHFKALQGCHVETNNCLVE